MDDSANTFFVVARAGLDSRARRIPLPGPGVPAPVGVEDIDPSEFPLCAVTVVCLHPRLRPFAPRELWGSWDATAVPGGERTQVARSHAATELVDPFLKIGGRAANPPPPVVDRPEAFACCYDELLVSERALGHADHVFLTAGGGARYVRARCRVRFLATSWADLPRCFATYDDALGLPNPPGRRRSGVEEYVDAVVGVVEDAARIAFREQAEKTGPHVGSFIPCSLWYGDELSEPECVLEVVGEVEGGARRCVLHALSNGRTNDFRAGGRLCTRLFQSQPTTGRGAEVVTSLGDVTG